MGISATCVGILAVICLMGTTLSVPCTIQTGCDEATADTCLTTGDKTKLACTTVSDGYHLVGRGAKATATACACANGGASTTATVCAADQESCSSCSDGFWLNGTANASSSCAACTIQIGCDEATADTCLTNGDTTKLACTTVSDGYHLVGRGAKATATVGCARNEHVVSNACASCGAGKRNGAGDDASGNDTECSPLYYEHTQYPWTEEGENSEGQEQQEVDNGFYYKYGSYYGNYTQRDNEDYNACDLKTWSSPPPLVEYKICGFTSCAVVFKEFKEDMCDMVWNDTEACGTTPPPEGKSADVRFGELCQTECGDGDGDGNVKLEPFRGWHSALLPNAGSYGDCTPLLASGDYCYQTDIAGNSCTASTCFHGEFRDGICSVVTCEVDEHVSDNTCTSCAPNTANEAGDIANGADTACDKGYNYSPNRTCRGDKLNMGTNDELNKRTTEHQCYSKCSDAEQEGCNGWTRDSHLSNRLCLGSTECLALCSTIDTCFGVDAHKSLDVCFLHEKANCDLVQSSEFNEFTRAFCNTSTTLVAYADSAGDCQSTLPSGVSCTQTKVGFKCTASTCVEGKLTAGTCPEPGNLPSEHMKHEGLMCSSWAFGIKTKCNKNTLWKKNKICEKSCCAAGLGYGRCKKFKIDGDGAGFKGGRASVINCTNVATKYMDDNNLTCATWGHLKHKCNKNAIWRDQQYCQQSCFNLGFYKNAKCSSKGVHAGDKGLRLVTRCTDVATEHMDDNNLTCATWGHLKHVCNKDARWRDEQYCQQSCFNLGFGYKNAKCSSKGSGGSPMPLKM